MNTFLNEIQKTQNLTVTENGAIAYTSSLNGLIDYFGQAGGLRFQDEAKAISLFEKAFAEDPISATRLLFYFRDVRGGQGERKHFRTVLKHLANKKPELVREVLNLIPEYGRWDDLFILLGTQLDEDVVSLICAQLEKDINSEKPSLLAKWMPSVNTSSKASRDLAWRFIREMDITPRVYRKALAKMRAKLNIVERDMCARNWDGINYEYVPSRANLIYNGAFIRHDEARRRSYLGAVQKGEAKTNASVLYPHEIVGKILANGYGWNGSFYGGHQQSADEELHLDNLWKNLPDFTGGKSENALVVADVSGSMAGQPLHVSVALAMYYAERNTGPFKNKFITFSRHPRLQDVVGLDVASKVRNLSQADWDGNTDIEAVFDMILRAAKTCDPEDVPTRLYIVSDMQFDAAVGRYTWGQKADSNSNKGLMQSIKAKYDAAGVRMPQLVFWNVRVSSANNVPMTVDDAGWLMVSGYSPSILKYIMALPDGPQVDNFTLKLISDVVHSRRYSPILS